MKNLKRNSNRLIHQTRRFKSELAGLFVRGESRKLAWAWTLCFCGVLVVGLYLQMQTTNFLGIADSRETVINFEIPVLVKRIHVIPGQAVSKGELLAELQQPELDLKVHEIKSALEKMRAEYNLKLEMNRLSTFQGTAKGRARQSLPNNLNFKTDGKSIDEALDPVAIDIKNLEQQLKVLQSREKELFVFAETAGVIGSVSYKKGELVSPFSPILTFSSSAPTYVQGFIYEGLHTKVKVGQKLKVSSIAEPGKELEGRVVSVGSRIVQFPIRLEKIPNVHLWGREVAIEIPDHNPFLLGEKVQIKPSFASISISTAQADSMDVAPIKPQFDSVPQPLTLPEVFEPSSAFEPSGLLYLKSLRKYVVITDDTDDNDSPLLGLMNSDGTVHKEMIAISGIERLQDAESITQGADGSIYILASQSRSSKSKVKRAREIMIKVEQNGLNFKATQSVLLRPLILEAAAKSKNKQVAKLALDFDQDLEIESSLIQNGNLLVGLKAPFDSKGQTLILNLGSVEEILNSQSVKEIEIAYLLNFPSQGQESTALTDLIQVGDELILTTVSKKPGKMGRLWKFQISSKEMKLISEFPSRAPEGVAWNPTQRELMVVFDEGEDTPYYLKIPFSETP